MDPAALANEVTRGVLAGLALAGQVPGGVVTPPPAPYAPAQHPPRGGVPPPYGGAGTVPSNQGTDARSQSAPPKKGKRSRSRASVAPKGLQPPQVPPAALGNQGGQLQGVPPRARSASTRSQQTQITAIPEVVVQPTIAVQDSEGGLKEELPPSTVRAFDHLNAGVHPAGSVRCFASDSAVARVVIGPILAVPYPESSDHSPYAERMRTFFREGRPLGPRANLSCRGQPWSVPDEVRQQYGEDLPVTVNPTAEDEARAILAGLHLPAPAPAPSTEAQQDSASSSTQSSSATPIPKDPEDLGLIDPQLWWDVSDPKARPGPDAQPGLVVTLHKPSGATERWIVPDYFRKMRAVPHGGYLHTPLPKPVWPIPVVRIEKGEVVIPSWNDKRGTQQQAAEIARQLKDTTIIGRRRRAHQAVEDNKGAAAETEDATRPVVPPKEGDSTVEPPTEGQAPPEAGNVPDPNPFAQPDEQRGSSTKPKPPRSG